MYHITDKNTVMISEQLGVEEKNVNLINNGNEGDIYSFIDKDGNKKVIKIFSNEISINEEYEDVRKDPEKQEELIKDTKKTLKPLENGKLITEDEEEISYQIYDYMEYDLNYAIKDNTIQVNSYEFFIIALRTVIGVNSLHKSGIAHRDIKPGNIMINTEDKKTKLIDFGLIEKLEANNEYKSIGTLQYESPELYENEKINSKVLLSADIYALGITLFEIITKNTDLRNCGFNDFGMKILSAEQIQEGRLKILHDLKSNSKEPILPYETKETRKKFFDLIEKMIDSDYKKRPDAKTVLKEMSEIYINIEKRQKKENIEEKIKLKPREKIMIKSLCDVKLSIKERELESLEEKALNKIKDIVIDEKTSDNLKNCIRKSINKIFNKEIFTFEDSEIEELNKEEQLKLKKIENRLREIEFAQNKYRHKKLFKKNKNKNRVFITNLKKVIESIENFEREERILGDATYVRID